MIGKLKRAVGIVLLGAAGMALWQAGVHVYNDHRSWHNLVEQIQAAERARQPQGGPK